MAGPSGTVASTSDAYGQQGTQGTQSDTYDALGRDVQLTSGSTTTSLSYQGNSGQLASDGGSHYTWTPGGTLTGTATAAGGTGVLDLTDHHTDLVGQFTAAGTTLSASRILRPVGRGHRELHHPLAGSLGYQSQYTSPVTGQTDMGARWYNPANGGFGNKDTVANNPVPDSASASPYAYAADNPLTGTDPTGHYAVVNIDGAVIPLVAAAKQAAPAPACPGVCIPVGAGIIGAGAAPASSAPASAPASPPSGLPPLALPPLGGTSAKAPSATLCLTTILGEVECPGTLPGITPAPGAGAGGTITPFTTPVTVPAKAPASQPAPSASAGDLTMTAAAQAQQRAEQQQLAPTATAADLTMTAAGQAQERAEQQQLAPAAVQAALPPPLPNPAGGNPKGKGPLSNPEQNVIQQGAAAAATIVKAVITTVDPAVQACVDTARAADCALAFLGGLGFFASDGASALDDPALAEGLGADTTDTGLTAGEGRHGRGLPARGRRAGRHELYRRHAGPAPRREDRPHRHPQARRQGPGHQHQNRQDQPGNGRRRRGPPRHQPLQPQRQDPPRRPGHPHHRQPPLLGPPPQAVDRRRQAQEGRAPPDRQRRRRHRRRRHHARNHDGLMWDLTVPGNNDHDFYVLPTAGVAAVSHHTDYAEAGATPVLVHNAGCGGLSSAWPAATNQESIDAVSPGDGFTGIFDPATGRFEARLSGDAEGAILPRRGGHRVLNIGMFNDSSSTVGFTAIVQDDGSLNVTWLSRGVTGRNFPGSNGIASLEQQQKILDALRAATGRAVTG